MVPAEESVHELAGAILDGSPIDWQLADSCAGETDRTLLEQLRVLAAIADVHRRPLEEDTGLREWGPLRVLEPIGRGAFGEVYRAWDTRLDREVALKLLPSTSLRRRNPSHDHHRRRASPGSRAPSQRRHDLRR